MAVQNFGEVFIKHPRYDVAANVRVSYDPDPAKHGGNYVRTATLNLDTGAACVQVYATAAALRSLATALMAAADAVDAGMAASPEHQLEAA